MRNIPLLVVLHCIYAVAALAEPLVKDTTTIRLFNGRNLDGLRIFAEPSVNDPSLEWKVEEGMLRCVGTHKGYVCTNTAYSDYHLRLEWRWPDKPSNSGVMINIVGPDVVWPKCIECQLAAGRAGDFGLFSDARAKEEIVSRNPAGLSTGRLPRTTASPVEKPPGEWNVYDITVAGDTITVSINGVQVNRMSGVQPSAGMIAFQAEGGSIDFRNIELTPLLTAKELNAPMPAPKKEGG